MASALEWSSRIKIFAVLIIIAGALDIWYSFWFGGINYYWAAFVCGALYIVVGFKGFHAATVKHISAARQYYKSLIVVALVIIILDVVSLALTNVFVNQEYDCNDYYYYSSCEDDMHAFRIALLISGIVSIGILVLCCACCISASKAFITALESENYPASGYAPIVSTAPPTIGYGASYAPPTYQSPPYPPPYAPAPNYVVGPVYPTNPPAYGAPAVYTTPVYPQGPSTYTPQPYPTSNV